MLEARSLHHVAFRTRRIDEASARWALLYGLAPVALDDARAILRCADEDYGLELLESDRPGHDHTAYELAPGHTLADAEQELLGRGVASFRVPGPAGRGEGLRFADPAGYGVELLEHAEPDDRRPFEAKILRTPVAAHPRRVQHVNVLCEDIDAFVAFYVDVLGFGVSDWIGDGACWLHVGPDHHVLAALVKPTPHFHHVALELVDWSAMRVALDHLAQHDRPVVWGPGRHAMARNLFSYVRMPEEDTFVELFCDMEILPRGHRPRRFPDDVHSSNAWGTLPPRTYFRFDEDAIRIEREQLIALGRELVTS